MEISLGPEFRQWGTNDVRRVYEDKRPVLTGRFVLEREEPRFAPLNADVLLTSLTTGSTVYNFHYGNFGLRSDIQVGATTLATYDYEDRTNLLKTLAYSNGNRVQYTYNCDGNITSVTLRRRL